MIHTYVYVCVFDCVSLFSVNCASSLTQGRLLTLPSGEGCSAPLLLLALDYRLL